MKLCDVKPVTHPDFAPYGQVLDSTHFAELCDYLKENTPIPEGSKYVASDPAAENLPVFAYLTRTFGGGLPIQIGWCNGTNTVLNALEYHNSGEINVSSGKAALLLARMQDMSHDTIDTAHVRGFSIECGQAVLLYATTLHFAPCAVDDEGFRMSIILPKDTNTPLDQPEPTQSMLRMKNKWLLAHRQAQRLVDDGAYVGLTGDFITLERC